jgi:hypothetical protein
MLTCRVCQISKGDDIGTSPTTTRGRCVGGGANGDGYAVRWPRTDTPTKCDATSAPSGSLRTPAPPHLRRWVTPLQMGGLVSSVVIESV